MLVCVSSSEGEHEKRKIVFSYNSSVHYEYNMSSEEKLINSSFVSSRKQPYVLLYNIKWIVMKMKATSVLIKDKRFFLDRYPLV